MGGSRTDEEARKRGEVAAYTRHLYERGGFKSQAEMAAALGVHSSSVSPWLDEQPPAGRGMSSYHLMRLIQEVERRKEGASAVPIDRPLETRLRALEKIVEAQGEAMTKALDGLAKEVRATKKQPGARDAGARQARG